MYMSNELETTFHTHGNAHIFMEQKKIEITNIFMWRKKIESVHIFIGQRKYSFINFIKKLSENVKSIHLNILRIKWEM